MPDDGRRIGRRDKERLSGKRSNELLADRITPDATLNQATNIQFFLMSPHCSGRIPPVFMR